MPSTSIYALVARRWMSYIFPHSPLLLYRKNFKAGLTNILYDKNISIVIYNLKFVYRNKWECFIAYNERKKIVDDMTKLPQFLRFDGVKLCLWSLVTSRHSIVNKCQLLVKYFQPHKKALNDTNLIHFDGITIDDARLGFFTDHSQFLNCLRRDLLPIFDKSRDYKFKIHFYSDRNSGANLIASMLQMDPIKRCSNLEILLYGLTQPTELPTDAISNWLNRESDGINKYSKERCLQISLGNIQTAQHLIDHLKAVIKFFLIWIWIVEVFWTLFENLDI